MKRNVLVMQFERGINQLNKFGVAGESIIKIRIPQNLSTQLTVSGVLGVHGKPAPQPVVVALKIEIGQFHSPLSTMALNVLEMTLRLKHATLMAAQVCHE